MTKAYKTRAPQNPAVCAAIKQLGGSLQAALSLGQGQASVERWKRYGCTASAAIKIAYLVADTDIKKLMENPKAGR